jgi:hypothetical protein
MKVVDILLEDGMDYTKAVKVAIREYKHVLENYLDEVIDNENSGRQNLLDLTSRNIFSLNIVPKKPSELCGYFK